MRIGIPTEIKTLEKRVALLPDACAELVRAGHEVWMQSGAGQGSGYADELYRSAGVQIAEDAAALYAAAELVVKVKEPQAGDLVHLRADHLLFCYLHLAAEPELTRSLCDIGLTGVAFETVTAADGSLPLLAPMSEIAGRVAVQVGTHLLHAPQGGKGLLLGGLAGAGRGHVVVIGAGYAGANAAELAASLGARVTVFDKKPEKLRQMQAFAPNIEALFPSKQRLDEALADCDLLIGAALIPGARAPQVVSAEQVAAMPPGSVIVDIAVDQGGCIATTRPTNYADPTYVEQGVLHFAVTNMPGAVPRSASQALSGSLLPYVQRLAAGRLAQDADLAAGINVRAGEVVLEALHSG